MKQKKAPKSFSRNLYAPSSIIALIINFSKFINGNEGIRLFILTVTSNDFKLEGNVLKYFQLISLPISSSSSFSGNVKSL